MLFDITPKDNIKDTSKKYKLNNILEIINEISQKNNNIFILAIDEAQYLKYSGKRYNISPYVKAGMVHESSVMYFSLMIIWKRSA